MRLRLLIFILVVFSLAGCGTPQAAAGHTLRIWYATDDPVERLWAKHLAQRFDAAHPAVDVQLTAYSFEDLNTKLQLALSAGTPPDLAYVTPRGPGIPAYVASHKLMDLTTAARRYGWAQKLLPGLLAQYNQPFSYLGMPKGHVVGVPDALAAVGVLYNRRLLRRLHLSVPSSIAAFQKDLARAKSARLTPLGMGNEDGWLGDDWYLTLINAFKPPAVLSPEQRLDPQFSFKRPVFKQAASIMRQWSRAGYLTHNFGGLDAQEGIDLFFRGKTLFQLVSSSENPQISHDERITRLPIGVFAFPNTRGGRTMPLSGYLGWVVPKAAQHPAQAIAFLNTLLAPPTARFLVAHGDIPAVRANNLHAPQPWERQYIGAVQHAQWGIYLDAAPISNINATMEANVQLLLQGYEPATFLPRSLQKVYTSRGKSGGSTARIDGEF